MKKLLAIIVTLFIILSMVVLFAGCAETATEVSREAIDVKYTEAYDSVVTDQQYRYNIFSGSFQLVPNVRTVHHAAKWEIQYKITYDNGEQKTK